MRVALLGGECTGKSTLATSLAHALDAPVANEALRDFVDERGRVPTAHEQRQVMTDQRDREDALEPAPIIICDPATLMTAIYSSIYYGDESLLSAALDQARDYTVILWCRPDIPWVPEAGQHDGEAARALADARIAALIDAAGWLPIVEISGDHASRMRAAQAAITRALA